MDFALTSQQQHYQTKARDFALEHIAPVVLQLEDDLVLRRQLFERMGKEGYFTLSSALPNGSKADSIAYLCALKEIAKVDAGISVAMTVTNMVAEIIARAGTQEQQMRYLQKIASGALVPASFALTEQDAGSDVKNISTVAEREPAANGDIFKLCGKKQMITNADLSPISIVFAKSDKGISAFITERESEGFAIVKHRRKMGLLTANLVDIQLQGCSAQLLGPEGEGLKIALGALDSGRLGVAAQALGIAEAAFEAAVQYAQTREQFGAPIASKQAIAFKLADMQLSLSAAELLIFQAAWRRDQGLPYSRQASEAKLFASEAACSITDEALQIFGGYGYTKDFPVEKYFRDARVTRIYEGTSEIQRLVIARHVLKP